MDESVTSIVAVGPHWIDEIFISDATKKKIEDIAFSFKLPPNQILSSLIENTVNTVHEQAFPNTNHSAALDTINEG